MSAPVPAIVLAGGKASAEFAAATGVTNRALVELVDGRTMLDLVTLALTGAETVGKIVVVGDIAPAGIHCSPSPEIARPGTTLLDNVLVGLSAVGAAGQDSVLLVGADIPFVGGPAIDDVVRAASLSGGDFCYPIVPVEVCRRQFAGMKRTTLKLREGEFTGGNIILIRAGVLTTNPDRVRAAYAGRKSVARIGAMLGWSLLARIVVSQIAAPRLLTVALLETAVGRLLGENVRARAIITNHASVATDVDKAEDVAVAREILGRRDGLG